MFKTRVRQFERGLWFRHGDFKCLVGPGTYRLWSRLWSFTRDRIEVVNMLATKFEHALLDVILNHPDAQRVLLVVDLSDTQRALVWKDNRLSYIVGPGRHAFWRTPYNLHVETFNVEDVYFEHPQREAVLAHPQARTWLDGVEVSAHEDVLLFHNGQLVRKLGPGKHVFWKGAGQITWKAVDRREQIADVTGQDIMTADKVTIRVNLVASYQVVDAEKAVTVVADAAQALYREAQLALRAAAGTRTLDALLADKDAVARELKDSLAARAATFGIEVRSIGLRDIILPGDMKELFNRVIAAEKEAQANLIKRREETAAIRSQANTAKVLAENPVLARLKELEALQEIVAGTKATFVFGPGDLATQIAGLIPSHGNDGPTG